MSNLFFLLMAVLLSVVGVMVLYLRNRSSSSPTSTIDEFHDKMRALAPEPELEHRDPDDLVVRRRRNRGA
jgi:hypothetical protein